MVTPEKLSEMLQGKNHAAIAKKAGTTRAYINQIASGARNNPSLQTVNRIIKAIESDTDKLCAACLIYYADDLNACPSCGFKEVM